VHRCTECGAASPSWVGRCATCGGWGTLIEEVEQPPLSAAVTVGSLDPPVPIAEIDLTEHVPRPTGIDELDRVLGGGLVPGSVTLLGGEPGIGKSTLVTQVSASVAAAGERVLYVSAEESRQQVRFRAERIGALVDGLYLSSEAVLQEVRVQLDEVKPSLLVVDSIQTVFDADFPGAPGSVVQVRSCAHRLVREAKERFMAVVLVGHVTKEGDLAGPRVLEHVVDTVLGFEGDRHHALRLLRAVKHRFGPAGELGMFELTDAGLAGVPDAGALLLADRRPGLPGSVVVPAMEGSRPLLVEVQALIDDGEHVNPRRSAQGIDGRRLATVVAVLDQRLGLKLRGSDIFALAAGGVRVHEPAADLAVALALVSSRTGAALPPDVVVCGEVGLGGEVRQVAHLARRLHEAQRLGFRRAVVPASAPDGPAGMQVLRSATIADACALAGLP
jgi:DNA repair protein RadA/Sms